MINAVRKLVLPIFFTFLLVGCQKESSAPEFEEFNLDQVSTQGCDPEEENCAFISVNIPWAKNSGSRNKTINRHVEQHVINLLDFQEENDFKSIERLSQNFIDSYEASAREFPEYNIPWEASVTGKLLYTSPEIISLQFDLALFTGGAHGYTSRSYLNFDPETGEPFSNEELFTAEFKDYAEKIFRKKNEIPTEEPINSTGYFFENDSFQLPQNIGFHKNKIILRYNAYEVASYAEGGIQIEIPKEEAENFVRIF